MPKNIYNNNAIISCPLVCDDSGYFYLVYKITNLVNGKIYIGKHSTKDPYDDYMGSGIAIISAIEKYGIENFSKEILFCFTNEKEAYLKEAEIVNLKFIDREDTYNMVIGGNNIAGSWSGEKHPCYGKPRSQETKDKISKAMSTQEMKDKISKAMSGENNPMYGKPGTRRGKKLTQETKDKMSKAHSGANNPMYGRCGEKNPRYGKHLSKETREKISRAHIGKLAGEKHPCYGKHLSKETREKISRAHIGKFVREKSPRAKPILKIDASGNIVAEYGCVKECREQNNNLCYRKLINLIKEHILYNGFYFEFKNKV